MLYSQAFSAAALPVISKLKIDAFDQQSLLDLHLPHPRGRFVVQSRLGCGGTRGHVQDNRRLLRFTILSYGPGAPQRCNGAP